jgi:hypothetical protein
MSEFNPNHTQYCRCLSCRTQRHSHQAFPESTLNAGLFAVGTAAVTLAGLTDTRGVKLVDSIPKSALTVTLRNVSISDDALVTAPDNVEYPFRMEPQASVELAVADVSTHSISATSEGVSVAVSYTRLMSERSDS